MLELILWLSVFVSVGTSIIRALNIGYQQQTYILSAIFQVPLIYHAYLNNSNQLIMLNVFYTLISSMGAYRWTFNEKQENKEN